MAISKGVFKRYVVTGPVPASGDVEPPFYGYCMRCRSTAVVPRYLATWVWSRDHYMNCATCGTRLGGGGPYYGRSPVNRVVTTNGQILSF